MSAVGEDIKQAFIDVGTAYSILRDSGTISGEFCKDKENRQVTKPFIKEFLREVDLPYDTQIIPGDVVSFDVTDEVFIVTGTTPQLLENEIIKKSSVFYKCNVLGVLQSPVDEDEYDTNYHREARFELKRANCYGLMTEALYGHDLDTDEELGAIGVENHELYVPGSYALKVLDRFQPVSGENEFYKVESVKKRKFNNVFVGIISEDTR